MPAPEIPAFLPADQYSRLLAASVRPPDWNNPRPAGEYNLVVVGGGPAGLVTAAAAVGLGARVALIERQLLGGDCLNYGCVPSKSLLRAARSWAEVREGERWGVTAQAGPGDFAAVMQRVRRLRAGLAPHDAAARFRDLGVDVYLGAARFVDRRSVEVGGQRLRFARACIATGARPRIPVIAGLTPEDCLTNETVFCLTELPRRLVVLGGGPIGCELAQAFARFGAAVTLVQRATRLLPRDEADASTLLLDRLRADGVDVRLASRVVRGERSSGGANAARYSLVLESSATSTTTTLDADAILAAAGREPNVDALDLDAAGVAYDARGIHVDDFLRTTNHRIYAAGDVCSEYQFTHVADAHARLVVQNALFFGRARRSRLIVPWCTYTDPEVAHVGLTSAAAEQAGLRCDTITICLENVDRAVLDEQSTGFLRLLVRRGTDRVLGGTIVASHAGDLAAAVALAITARIGLKQVARTIFPYPTQAEVLKKAADAFNRNRLTPRVARWLAWLMRWRRERD